jgi:type II secretory pathway component PulM
MSAIAILSAKYEQAVRYWRSRSPREQVLVATALVALLVTATYNVYWKPVTTAVHRLKTEIPVAQKQLAEMRVQSLKAPRPVTPPLAGGLLPALEKSLETHGIRDNLGSMEPGGDNTAKLTLEQIEYTHLVKWLLNLSRQFGIEVQSTTISATGVTGMVTARITLSSGS